MALGGVLRAALRAGDWARAAAQSRRQARLLRNFSADFGERAPSDAATFLRRRGVDVDAMTAPGTGNPYLDWVADYDGSLGYYADSPFGGIVQSRAGGGRFRPAPEMYSPIVAPYEGFRALPGGYNARYGETMIRPGPWMGRGRGTEWAELPRDGGPPYDLGSYFEQFPGPNRGVSGLGTPFDGIRPTFPWRAFGEYPPPYPRDMFPDF